jgi:hypothetical protein
MQPPDFVVLDLVKTSVPDRPEKVLPDRSFHLQAFSLFPQSDKKFLYHLLRKDIVVQEMGSIVAKRRIIGIKEALECTLIVLPDIAENIFFVN